MAPQCSFRLDLPEGQFSCSNPPLSNGKSGLCVLHAEDEKDPTQFQSSLEAVLQNGGALVGCVFPEQFRWEDVEVEQEMTFIKARFRGRALFQRICFDREVSFHGAVFERGVSFEGTDFNGGVSFEKARFLGRKSIFDGARFLGGETLFTEASVEGKVISFRNVLFSSDFTSFEGVTCKGELLFFGNAHFQGQRTTFDRATFIGERTSFEAVDFGGEELTFWKTRFEGQETSFLEATMGGHQASFVETEFVAKFTDFEGARFGGDLVSFDRTAFGPRTSFRRATFPQGLTRFHTNMEGISFREAVLEHVTFSGAQWPRLGTGRMICPDEEEAQAAQEYQEAAAVCRNIKQSYQRTGEYRAASDFYIGEMECLRRAKDSRLVRSVGFQQLSRFMCGYGERPARVILSSVILVFVAALAFLLGGLCSNVLQDAQTQGALRAFGLALYQSFITFTTLGYGDLHPCGIFSRVVASLEAFTGAFMMALFVRTFGRKMMR